MSIWCHEAGRGVHRRQFADDLCPFCSIKLRRIEGSPFQEDDFAVDLGRDVDVCPACGWWRVVRAVQDNFPSDDPFTPGTYSHRLYGAAGCLRELDVMDGTLPLDEVRRYLLVREAARFDIGPRVMEETVAAVFRDMGFETLVTSYSNDGGIDVILHEGTKSIGVQVKRYKGRIGVEQIRSLVGALMLRRHAAGVFVTTSDFQRGCYRVAEESASLNLPIQLVDGRSFLDALRIANIATWADYDVSKPPFACAKLELVAFNHGACGGKYTNVWEVEGSRERFAADPL